MQIRIDSASAAFDVAGSSDPDIQESHGFTYASTDAQPPSEVRTLHLIHADVPPGLICVLGAAGSGKSTFIRSAVPDSPDVASIFVPLNEPDYIDASEPGFDGNQAMLKALITAARIRHSGKSSLVVIDSLRHLTMLGTGYGSRLARAGFDLTMFQAMSDLDRVAKRLGIHVMAAVFLNTFQLSAGDSSDTTALNSLLNTIALDMDGCVEATIRLKFGAEPGHYIMTTRSQRDQSWTGRLAIGSPAITEESTTVAPPWQLSVPSMFAFDSKFIKERAGQISNQIESPVKVDMPELRDAFLARAKRKSPEISSPSPIDRASLERLMKEDE